MLRTRLAGFATRSRTMASNSEASFCYKWARPGLTVDAILIACKPQLSVLLIERKHDPYAGSWALPGGFVEENEPLHVAAARELLEETSVKLPKTAKLSQVGAYGNPGRDPRGWTIGVAFATLIPEVIVPSAADDASDARWFSLTNLPKLAFDHGSMIHDALIRLSYNHTELKGFDYSTDTINAFDDVLY